jgi:hypothetical protein
MEVGQGLNWRCSAKKKLTVSKKLEHIGKMTSEYLPRQAYYYNIERRRDLE